MSLIPPQETPQYTKDHLEESGLSKDPADQFRVWFKQAQSAGIELPEAVSLATAELPSGRVSVRTVLMKELDQNGNFVIYSNWEHSRKAADVKSNPHGALSFWWKELERSVRIEGRIERMSLEESEVYYQTRPRGSQIGAWASKQSQPVQSRAELDANYEKESKKHEGEGKLKCPPFWGGVRVIPDRWEFWQGRESRVHDRIQYIHESKEQWEIQRINP